MLWIYHRNVFRLTFTSFNFFFPSRKFHFAAKGLFVCFQGLFVFYEWTKKKITSLDFPITHKNLCVLSPWFYHHLTAFPQEMNLMPSPNLAPMGQKDCTELSQHAITRKGVIFVCVIVGFICIAINTIKSLFPELGSRGMLLLTRVRKITLNLQSRCKK